MTRRTYRCLAAFVASLALLAVFALAQNQNEPPATKPAQSQPASQPAEGSYLLKTNFRAGQAFKLVQTGRYALTVSVTREGETTKQENRATTKTQIAEQILEADAGRPTKVEQRVELAQADYRDPDTGEQKHEDLPVNGVDAVLTFNPDGTMEVESVKQGDEEAADQMASETRWFSLVPGKSLKVGDTWQLTGEPLTMALAALNAEKGEVSLRLVKVEKDAQLGQEVAQLEGKVKVRMQLGGDVEGDAEGTLSETFAIELGVPLMRQLKVTLKVDQSTPDGKVVGNGEIELREERTPAKAGQPKETTAPANPEKK